MQRARALSDAEPLLGLAQQQHAAIDEGLAASTPVRGRLYIALHCELNECFEA